MKQYIAHLQSITPYSQGRNHNTPRERESDDAYAERTALQRMHTSMGKIVIPPMAFHLCLQETASYIKMKIKGQGTSTYTKNFIRGLLFNEPVILDKTLEDCRIEKVFVPAQPNKPGSRVWKYYPVLDTWEAMVPFIVVDELLTKEILKRHWEMAGVITGIGVWRPINRGLWGKFKLLALEEVEEM